MPIMCWKLNVIEESFFHNGELNEGYRIENFGIVLGGKLSFRNDYLLQQF